MCFFLLFFFLFVFVLCVFFSKRWFNGLVQNRWFILACACAIIAVQGGFFMSFGSLFVDLLEEFNEPRAQTAAILSVYNAVNLISGKKRKT